MAADEEPQVGCGCGCGYEYDLSGYDMPQEHQVDVDEYEDEDEYDLTRYDTDEIFRIGEQIYKDACTLNRYLARLLERLNALPTLQRNRAKEKRRLLSKRIEALIEEYEILSKISREDLSEELESINAMLSDIATECDSKLKKLYLEYVGAIWMMKLKVGRAFDDYTQLLARSMDVQKNISLFECKLNMSCGVMTEIQKYDFVNVVKMMRVRSDLDHKVDMLLSQKSMNLSWKPFVDLTIKKDGEKSLLRKFAEKDEDHPLMYRYKFEVEDDSVVGRENEVEGGFSSDQWSLHGNDPEWNPRLLERQYFVTMIERLPPRLGNNWLKGVSLSLKELECFTAILKMKETFPAKHDKLQQDYEYWDGECHRVAKELSKKIAYYSRRIDSLNAIVSDVTFKYMDTLQIMSSEFGNSIEWMKSKHRLIHQENVCLGRLVACQETKLFSIQNKSGGETVLDPTDDAEPLCNGTTWSSSEILTMTQNLTTNENLTRNELVP